MFVCILLGKAVLEMTYYVSDGTLNPTHSLTLLNLFFLFVRYVPNVAKWSI